MDKTKLLEFVLKVETMAKEFDIAMFLSVQNEDGAQCRWFLSPSWTCIEIMSRSEIGFRCTEERYPTPEARGKVTSDSMAMLQTFAHVLSDEAQQIQEVAEHISKHIGGTTGVILKGDDRPGEKRRRGMS